MCVPLTFERIACDERGGRGAGGEEEGADAEVCGFGRGFAGFGEGEVEVVGVVVGHCCRACVSGSW